MWEHLIHRIFGIGGEGATQLRFGAGVVYLTTAAFIAFCIASGGVAWALSKEPIFAVLMAAIMALLGMVFFLGTWRFADKHPDQAALGGSWWYKLRALQMEEAKGQPPIPTLSSSTDPLKPLPPTSATLLDAPDDEA
jgi:hypothetical protein